jgi:hypothetical protein
VKEQEFAYRLSPTVLPIQGALADPLLNVRECPIEIHRLVMDIYDGSGAVQRLSRFLPPTAILQLKRECEHISTGPNPCSHYKDFKQKWTLRYGPEALSGRFRAICELWILKDSDDDSYWVVEEERKQYGEDIGMPPILNQDSVLEVLTDAGDLDIFGSNERGTWPDLLLSKPEYGEDWNWMCKSAE